LSAAEQAAGEMHRAIQQWGTTLVGIHEKLRKNLQAVAKMKMGGDFGDYNM
jgi:hypothetical protein